VQGRLFGGKNTVESASIVIGLVGAGALEATVGVRLTLATGAAICSVCAVAALVALASQARGSTPLTKGAPAAS
jgi:hypothetical protein